MIKPKLLQTLLSFALALALTAIASPVAFADDVDTTPQPGSAHVGIAAIFVSSLNLFLTSADNVLTSYIAAMPPAPDGISVNRTTSTSLTIKWNKVADAAGYEVFRYDSTKKDYVKVKTVGSSKQKWTNKKLKTNKTYKYKVRAYTTANSNKVYGAFTYVVSAKVYAKDAKKVNVGSFGLIPSVLYIGINETVKLSAKVGVVLTPSKYGNAKKKTVIDKKVKWICKTNSVLNLDNKGYLTAKQTGTANIYALAHNGTLKKLKVYVADYAKPAKWNFEEPVQWEWGLDRISTETINFLIEQRDDITTVAAFFDMHHSKADADANYNGTIFDKYPEGPTIKAAIDRLKKTCPYSLHVNLRPDTHMEFEMFTGGGGGECETIAYNFKDFSIIDETPIAPRWTYSYFIGD